MAGERAAKDSAKDGGSPVATAVRAPIEASFGTSLGHVRVYSGGGASARVDSQGARAFTYGPNIFLGSGQSSSDVALMAHESAHVVQQGPGSRTMQFAGTGVANRFEVEAEQASTAVLAGVAFPVRERTGGAVRQFSWFSRAVSAVGGAVSSAVSAVGNVAGAIRDRVLRFISEHAGSIPGFDLLTVILGRNPVTGQPVERNAVNLIRGFMGLIPGGAALFEKIQQTQIIQRAYEWFSQEIPKLNLTWDAIVALFRRAWDSLSASDLLNPGGVFERMRGIFGPPLSRLINFALAAGSKLLEFVVEGALKIAGDAGGRVMAMIRRAGSVIQMIINDPIAFGRNLIAAVRGGFGRFTSNIVEHLRNGLIGWLTGALTGAGIRLPRSFTDWQGIIAMVLDIIGLTYQLFRRLLVRAIGEERVRFLEGVFDFLRILVTQGLGAAWEKIKEYASNLTDMVIGGIRGWVERTVVGQAITRLLSMLSPVGALIQTAIAIYNTVMFFVERIQQIMQLANSVFDSIANIASGNISGAITYVEQAMARTLPVIISFLARLIGLGGISERIREIITRIRTAVEGALGRVVDWIVARVRGLVSGGAPGSPQSASAAAQSPVGAQVFEISLDMNGQTHQLALTFGPEAHVDIASANRELLSRKISRVIPELRRRNPANAAARIADLTAIITIVMTIEQKAKADARNPATPRDQIRNPRTQLNQIPGMAGDFEDLKRAVERYGRNYGPTDIEVLVASATAVSDAERWRALVDRARHVPPAAYSSAKHWRGRTEDQRRDNSRNGGPGQFLASMTAEEVKQLERSTLLEGTRGQGGSTVEARKRYDNPIGYAEGELAHWHLAAITAIDSGEPTIHSHPRPN
jgi:Domain of unknown function (DUF4157)